MKRRQRTAFRDGLRLRPGPGLALAAAMWLGRPPSVAAQRQFAEVNRPRFMQLAPGKQMPEEVDADHVPILRHRVVLDRAGATLGEMLQEITRQTGLRFAYDADAVPVERAVGLRAASITVGAALTEILIDLHVDVLLKSPAQAVLLRRDAPRRAGAIAGTITDAKTGHDVPSAEIFLERTHWRTSADTNGRYRLLEVDIGSYILTVRRLGYAKQSRPVTVGDGRTDTVDVALEPVATRLQELVTTATGRQRRLDVPNDITTINVDSVMQAAPVHSVTDLLEHRVPGLTVQRTSGAPGDPARLRLRGSASPLQSNDPIVVVDGVRVYAEQSSNRGANLADPTGFAAPSPLDYIDPNSIETIEVVKGPSAATLYGQDAANGVIVIRTKKGRAGPTRWTMAADYGRTRIVGDYPNLLFRWGHSPDLQRPMFCPVAPLAFTGLVQCEGDSIKAFQLLNDPALTVLDKGRSAELTVGASGGTQALTYRVGGSYSNQLGLVKLPEYEIERYQTLEGALPPEWMRRPQRFKQWAAISTIAARLGPRADVSLTTSLSRAKQQRSDLEQQLGDLMGTFFDRGSGLYYRDDEGNLRAYDYRIAAYRLRATDAATQFTNGLNASWRLRDWLTLTADAGLNIDQRADETFFPTSRDSLFNGGNTGFLDFGNGTSIVSTVNAGGVATAPLGHGIQFRLASGVNYTGRSINDAAVPTTHVPYGTSLIGTLVGTPNRYVQDDATFGWYVAPSITHPRFSVDLGLRLDGGSAYGSKVSGFKLPAFPKLGFSYLLSEAPFFPFKNVFQSFRVRTAYGRAGRQPGPADRLRLYGTVYRTIGGDSNAVDVVELRSLGNTEVRPERTTELEGGFDADLLDSRLNVALTGYRKTTNDALISVPLAPSVYGANVSIMRNIGVVRNTGLELSVDVQPVRSSAMTWSIRFTLRQNRNKVVRLGPGVQPFYTDLSYAGAPTAGGTRVAAGYPLFGRWSRPVLGYTDANGDKVLEPSEVLLGDTAVYVGQQEPDYETTIQPSLSIWHGALTVTAMLARTGGVSQKNEVARRLSIFSRGANDPTASLAEQLATGTVANTDFNWIQTVSTTRFDNLSVRYAIPAGIARRLGAQQLSIAVQGSNLGLWTNYRGLDPEVNAFPTGNSVTDTGVLPMPRAWQVRIDANY